ncbi:DUF2267 domain-containing protein [Streptomyces sp. MST-110588]|uniref:DUF2267 domain-containing protein n=1 Tax=Streptomyces sp. MST-110588 TaxID=2833628 RepID=UPI001F5D9266|nr:DUF2267 domain-containing protein [Streptomyces sp. MST-110588]UNO42902.1 DUF2267 domain-containing protein [Streptomyces sp. MST-110588]
MRHDEFIGLVQDRAALPDRGSAERAVRATLETVAERVPDGLVRHLAAQLPQEIAEHLHRVEAAREAGPEGGDAPERFDLTAFAGRVAWRGAVSEETAVREAAAVFEVLDAALAPELMERLSHALPQDIRELLPTARAQEPT